MSSFDFYFRVLAIAVLHSTNILGASPPPPPPLVLQTLTVSGLIGLWSTDIILCWLENGSEGAERFNIISCKIWKIDHFEP